MPKKKAASIPERTVTPRTALREALLGRALSAREIAKRVGMRDKEVAEHLPHLARSLATSGERLIVEPAKCLTCGFVFESRGRWTTPSRCPACRSERVAPPSFRVEGAAYPSEAGPRGMWQARRDTPAGLDPAARSRDDASEMAGHESPHDVVLQAESAVSSAIFSTAAAGGERHTRVATGAEALLRAAGAAREGKRVAAVLAPRELLGALEALHAVARARAPIVVHVLGGAGGMSTCAGRDEIALALDTGAGVVVTWNAQESVDLTLAVRRAAEDAETPFLLVTDGSGPVMALPGGGLVDTFLGPCRPVTVGADPYPAVARDGPMGETAKPPAQLEAPALDGKRRERSFAARVPFALAAAMRELGDLTGRTIAPAERYETADAEEILVAVGQAYAAARAAAEALRQEGRRVGAVGVRVLRPFFSSDLVKAVARARAVAVIEPLDVALAPAGPLATCLKAAFADALTWAPGFPGVGHIPTIVSVAFATIVGAVTEREVREALGELSAGDRAKRLLVFGSDGT
jgi:pyruvate-ferredoxin/flavodoxin oxidoreductase